MSTKIFFLKFWFLIVHSDRALNDMLRNQKDELRKLTMPMIEELSGKMILNMLNQIMSGLPLEEIFLPD